MNKNYTIITGGGGFLAYFFAEVILEENKNLFLIDIDKKKLKQNQIKLEKIFKQKFEQLYQFLRWLTFLSKYRFLNHLSLHVLAANNLLT